MCLRKGEGAPHLQVLQGPGLGVADLLLQRWHAGPVVRDRRVHLVVRGVDEQPPAVPVLQLLEGPPLLEVVPRSHQRRGALLLLPQQRAPRLVLHRRHMLQRRRVLPIGKARKPEVHPACMRTPVCTCMYNGAGTTAHKIQGSASTGACTGTTQPCLTPLPLPAGGLWSDGRPHAPPSARAGRRSPAAHGHLCPSIHRRRATHAWPRAAARLLSNTNHWEADVGQGLASYPMARLRGTPRERSPSRRDADESRMCVHMWQCDARC